MAKDANFIKILDVLKETHEKMPDLRFGQVLQVALDSAKRSRNIDLTDVSSKVIYNALLNLNEKEIEKREKFKQKKEKAKQPKIKITIANLSMGMSLEDELRSIPEISLNAVNDILKTYPIRQTLIEAIYYGKSLPISIEMEEKVLEFYKEKIKEEFK